MNTKRIIKKPFERGFKLGIIGGGQLGEMLSEACKKIKIDFEILDDYKDYDKIIEFGSKVDFITIEIEHVNVDALYYLEEQKIPIYPKPLHAKIIQDKHNQKQFYSDINVPIPKFTFYEKRKDYFNKTTKPKFPIVWKSVKEGYDGKGVRIFKTKDELEDFLKNGEDQAFILEDFLIIKQEISVLVARNISGQMAVYPVLDMNFDKEWNLISEVNFPSKVTKNLQKEAQEIAKKIVETLEYVGISAIEMIVDGDNKLWINEMAIRPHNSGHLTIEASKTSQYENHLRSIFNLPIGDTDIDKSAKMINLYSREKMNKSPVYLNFSEIEKIESTFIKIYNKEVVKSFRKMGHITILAENGLELEEKANKIKNLIGIY